MSAAQSKTKEAKYSLDRKGCFTIENYNASKPFANFFPGIAGLWGIPMWVFYVNRGQCISSCGLESKNKAIMEFQPANKAYRLTALQGFRTFIKVKQGRKVSYWEPFQENLPGTDYSVVDQMKITAHDLTLVSTNEDLGLTVQVNYFTLPEEDYASLVRRVTVKNTSNKACEVELIDGLPIIMPYGLNDGLIKNISRTVEAWSKVRNIDKNAPYYHLNVEVADTPQVKHIKEGHFYFSFDPKDASKTLHQPLVESACVFGASVDFTSPQKFIDGSFDPEGIQHTSNRTPSAMTYTAFNLPAKKSKENISLLGYAESIEQLNTITQNVREAGFIQKKADRNAEIIEEIKQYALTNSSSSAFNQYSEHTFLDNILRGGLPVSVKTTDGNTAFNVYSRKHGDLERDYNFFTVAPTVFSQGNGNYRDVNQNRRNDIWFNSDVQDDHLINFLNLSQADGYNPLVVKGTSFKADNKSQLLEVLNDCIEGKTPDHLVDFIMRGFLPGDLVAYTEKHHITFSGEVYDFLGRVLEICHKQELADHGEGFWSDHWTYNLDLVESYLALYPDRLKSLLLEKKAFRFYHNNHYVLPREQRYILTDHGVRQYESVGTLDIKSSGGTYLRERNGEGGVYETTLITKLLCLIANKAATLDPSGCGIEMEADKPNWYDALNGLPGLLGSSLSETLELKRYSVFLLESLKQLSLSDKTTFDVYEELANFIDGLANILQMEQDAQTYWSKTNDIKENYRKNILQGVTGTERKMKVKDIRTFLERVIQKTDQAKEEARNGQGFLATYFYHSVKDYKTIENAPHDGHQYVRPTSFEKHALPLFLEGYVHAMRAAESKEEARKFYAQVRESHLYDRKLKMYKVNQDLSNETEEIGRTRIFPSGWLENESVWLHMEYKFILEIVRNGLFSEFYDNMKDVLVPFQKPQQYGRSILENSSFIVSSAHSDESLHGQGFVARLSGSTAEFMHIWLYLNAGKAPFQLDAQGKLMLSLQPALAGWLFTKKKTKVNHLTMQNEWKTAELDANTYAFNLFGRTLVIYHNPKRKDTFGQDSVRIKSITLTYPDKDKAVQLKSSAIPEPYSKDIRDRKVERIDAVLG